MSHDDLSLRMSSETIAGVETLHGVCRYECDPEWHMRVALPPEGGVDALRVAADIIAATHERFIRPTEDRKIAMAILAHARPWPSPTNTRRQSVAEPTTTNDYDFDGPLRVEVEQAMTFSTSTGESGLQNAMRIYRQKDNGRWVQVLPGPVMATEDGMTPSRSQLLQAAARIIGLADGGL